MNDSKIEIDRFDIGYYSGIGITFAITSILTIIGMLTGKKGIIVVLIIQAILSLYYGIKTKKNKPLMAKKPENWIGLT